MPGSIHISATQPSVITPLFLQVAVGKREYSGNIEQDGLSFPVTSLRESMVIKLYSADRELISKAELKTKAIVESGTMDAVFTLDSGGKIILQVQFLLNDDDRKRIQEMRSSAMKRKQQELLGDGNELNFPGSSPLVLEFGSLSRRLIEKISNIQSKGAERSKLRKSLSLDDLQERAVFSGINVDPLMKASRDSLLQRGVKDTSRLESPSGSKKGNSIPESKSSSSVKKMISTFEGTTPQSIVSETDVSPTPTPMDSGSTQAGKTGIPCDDHKASNYKSGKTVSSENIKISAPVQTGMPKTIESRRSQSETGVSPTPIDSGSTQAGKIVIPFDDHKASNYKSGNTILSRHIKMNAPVQTGMPKTTESRRSHKSGKRDGASKQNLRENELIRTKRRLQAKHRCSIGPSYLPEQMHSRDYIERPFSYLVTTSSTWIHPHICVTSASKQLKDLLELEHLNSLAHIQHTAKRQHVQKSTQENKSDEFIASAQTQSSGFPMINWWLINKGVRAAIVVIACGAMFFNNK